MGPAAPGTGATAARSSLAPDAASPARPHARTVPTAATASHRTSADQDTVTHRTSAYADTSTYGEGSAHAHPPVPGTPHTEVLDVARAGVLADPGAATQVIGRTPVVGPGPARSSGPDPQPGAVAPPPLVSRRVAAEIGMYCGAALALVAILGVVVRGWSAWDWTLHVVFVALSTSTLVAAGLFLRLPRRRVLGAERRRAVSGLLTTGVAVASSGIAVALRAGQDPGAAAAAAAGSGPGSLAVAAVGAAVAMLAVTALARTPLSETGLLVALAWAAWVVAPPGPGTWAFLAGLALTWAVLGHRWARGRRTAVLLGVSLALACSVGMATGPWAWPTRAALAVVAAVGLGAFLRGRANAWLALGAGAATALSASVAGDVVGPALALLLGGVATMVVSGIALRGARPR